MTVNVAQLERQARLRYLPLKPFEEQGISHLINPSCAFVSRGDTFGSVIEHCLESDQELGRRMFGNPLFDLMLDKKSFPLLIESYSNISRRRARAMPLRALGYQVIEESYLGNHLNFVRTSISVGLSDKQLVRHVPLLRGKWQEIGTTDAAIVVVPSGRGLDVAHSDGNEILPAGNAAILMAGARVLVQGAGMFVFHPTGMLL